MGKKQAARQQKQHKRGGKDDPAPPPDGAAAAERPKGKQQVGAPGRMRLLCTLQQRGAMAPPAPRRVPCSAARAGGR